MTKEKMQIELLNLCDISPKTIVFVTHDLEEALFISDRAVIMTARPARIAADIKITFPKPRLPALRTSPEFQKLRSHLRDVFSKAEARISSYPADSPD